MNPKEVLEFAKKNNAKQLDMRFTDIPSLQHHISYPISQLEESSFEKMDTESTDRASVDGPRLMKATCFWCRTRTPRSWIPSPISRHW